MSLPLKKKINARLNNLLHPGFNNVRFISPRALSGFTLIEIMIAVSIFTVLMAIMAGIIMGLFKTMRQGEDILNKEQRQRMCFSRLSRDISSLAKASLPNSSFVGAEGSFFLPRRGKTAW
jgi:prepilin-type N-terminal cleavage/methylation domain-containing protein